MKNKIFNSTIIIISFIIFIIFFIMFDGFNILSKQMNTLNLHWFFLALFCVFIFWILETSILLLITKTLYPIDSLTFKSIKFAMVGQFFNSVTPFQSGGQPAQMYVMAQNGIPIGVSGSILIIKFIIHQITLTIYSIIVILFKFDYFSKKIPYFLYFCFIGFIINTVIILFALVFSASSNTTKFILRFSLQILGKVKLIKNPEATYKKLEIDLIVFHENSTIIYKNMFMSIFSTILTFIQWSVYYSIPYFIYRSFGFSYIDIFSMISASVFLTMFMSFIPLPGASLGAEGGFFMIFSLFFPGGTVVPAIFIWRLITYYANIAFGGIFSILLPNKKESKLV